MKEMVTVLVDMETYNSLELNRIEGQTFGDIIAEVVRFAIRKDYFV